MPNTHSTLSSLFTDIANAIRTKTGSSAQIVADDFPTEIANIPSGGIDPSDATATESDILNPKTAYLSDGTKHTGSMVNRGAVSQTLDTTTTSYTIPSGYHNGNGSVSVTTQTKSVSPTTSAQTISADSGKVLSSVSVGAIQTQTKSVTPSTSAQTVTPDSGKYLTSVSVGAISTQTKSATPSTSAQTVTPDSGKYLTSVSVGAIPNQHSGKQGDITPSSSAQTVYIPSGWYDGSAYFSVGASSGISVTVPTTYGTTLIRNILLSNSGYTSLTKYVENGRFYWLKSAALYYNEISCQGGVIAFGCEASSGLQTKYMPYIITNTNPQALIGPPNDRGVLIFVFDKSTAQMKSSRSAACSLYPMN